jgi:Glycosyl transferase family 2/Methyltransferase domain
MPGYPATIDGVRVLDRCPACESAALEYEFRIDRGRVSRCTACTLLFLREQPAAAAAPQPPYGERITERIAHVVASARVTPRTVLAVVPSAAGERVEGADVVAAEELIARGAPDRAYDAAVCIDVLDRVPDPAAVLRRIRAALAPGAPASFTVPSVSSSAARYAGASWRGFRSGAAVFYSVDTLQSLLVREGFREAKFYTDGALRPGSLRVRTAARMLGAVGLRGPAVSAQRSVHLIDETMTAVAVRGEPIARPLLSVIVPVYNERATFRELMDRLIAKEIPGADVEIIVVESNSKDGSREEVQSYADHPRVTVVLQDRPNGKGNAVREGLTRARGDIVLFQDADLEYEIDDYDDLIRPIAAYQRNFVIGSRHAKKGSAWKMREFNGAPVLSQVFNFGHVLFLGLLNGLYGQSLDDPFSMFKVFRRDCLAGLVLECNRFDFDFEIVIKLLRKGYRPLEIPVNYHSRSIAEGKKVSMVRDPVTWLAALARYRTSPLYPQDAR